MSQFDAETALGSTSDGFLTNEVSKVSSKSSHKLHTKLPPHWTKRSQLCWRKISPTYTTNAHLDPPTSPNVSDAITRLTTSSRNSSKKTTRCRNVMWKELRGSQPTRLDPRASQATVPNSRPPLLDHKTLNTLAKTVHQTPPRETRCHNSLQLKHSRALEVTDLDLQSPKAPNTFDHGRTKQWQSADRKLLRKEGRKEGRAKTGCTVNLTKSWRLRTMRHPKKTTKIETKQNQKGGIVSERARPKTWMEAKDAFCGEWELQQWSWCSREHRSGTDKRCLDERGGMKKEVGSGCGWMYL